MAEPQVKWGITAQDRSKAAFDAFRGNVRRTEAEMVAWRRGSRTVWTDFRAGVNGAIGDVKRFQGLWKQGLQLAGFLGGINLVRDALDRNLIDGAEDFKTKWRVAIGDWKTALASAIGEIALELDQLIQKVRGPLVAIDEFLRKYTGKGLFMSPIDDFLPGPGSGPQRSMTAGKGDRLGTGLSNNTTINQPGRSSRVRTSRGRSGGREFDFDRDVARGLREEIGLLQLQSTAVGKSEGALAELEARQRAINEIRRQGREPTADELRQINELAGAFGQATDALEEHRKRYEEFKETVEAFAETFTSSLDDAFGQFLDTGKLKFRSFIDSLLKDMARLAFQQFLTKPLGSWLGGLLGSADGNAFSRGRVTAFASGGIVSSPTVFPMANGAGIMGEAGPEAVMPLSRGADGKLGVKGGGGVSVPISISIDARGADNAAAARIDARMTKLEKILPSLIKDTVSREKQLNPLFGRP